MPTYFETELALRAAQIRKLKQQNLKLLELLSRAEIHIRKNEATPSKLWEEIFDKLAEAGAVVAEGGE